MANNRAAVILAATVVVATDCSCDPNPHPPSPSSSSLPHDTAVLGALVGPRDVGEEPGGLDVYAVNNGSLAERGGLRVRDILISVNGQRVESTEALEEQLRRAASRRLELRVYRDSAEVTLAVTLPAEGR